MVNAPTPLITPPAWIAGLMMNKSLRGGGAESSHKTYYGFQLLVIAGRPKKEPPFPAAFEVDNREASNRVDRSHSVSKQGRFKSYSRKLNRS
jgi:hypothetical protein